MRELLLLIVSAIGGMYLLWQLLKIRKKIKEAIKHENEFLRKYKK